MQINVIKKDNDILVKLGGEIDFNTSIDLREKLIGLISSLPANMIVDMSGVEYIDSSGVATLVEILQALGKKNGKLIIAGLKERVKDVFDLAHLNEVFTITEDLRLAEEKIGKSF